jgi:transposase, IS6 family
MNSMSTQHGARPQASKWPLALRLPSDRSVRTGHRRVRLTTARFFERAIDATRITPSEVVTDRAPTYPMVLDELLPAAWHRTDQLANNRIEADHGVLKSRLRPMRGLKQDRNARVIIVGHAFVRNIRRGHYELAVEEPTSRRLAVAFAELALVL